ncbi:rhomboid family intramembrane serine protease [Larsenimonas rhizosphaerae]|uniref:Rhomboid family intramembrane serine protease n=1 Tax=Larsenimonas rhizosphaerae TaxID=2944682 RepID=A0AA41ZKA0_9GAMM|nr:rhomboid family intramembrane serine protease [Larsenimonas rhizosphaerae]MCM2130508.1 rhomboid family intramembrane serine protease [Larsenimonas rhizosphaerae]MCX2523213.1 rhomboid family intramembrane serine protease [Larsenimonas rhizosphaerae]
MAKVLQFPTDIDLSVLRKALWDHRISHHYRRDDNEQLIFLMDDSQLDQAVTLTEQFRNNDALTLSPDTDHPRTSSAGSLRHALAAAPLTSGCIVLCALVYLLMNVVGVEVVTRLTIVPMMLTSVGLQAGTLGQALTAGEFWRLLTPVFLHFGWMHLVFNMVWLWYFGRQIEQLQGQWRWLLIVILTGIGSNLAQYAMGTLLFGGMSGVIYALVGYVWLWSREKDSGFNVPTALVVFMVGWMVLCMTPLSAAVGFPNVANEAHLAGMLGGLILGKLTLLLHRR